jgi:hypothetical protein
VLWKWDAKGEADTTAEARAEVEALSGEAERLENEQAGSETRDDEDPGNPLDSRRNALS